METLLCHIIRRLCVISICALIAACSYLPPEIVPVKQTEAPPTLRGINNLVQELGFDQIRILFIHGMGPPDRCEADGLLLHLTKALEVRQTLRPDDRPHHHASSCSLRHTNPSP